LAVLKNRFLIVQEIPSGGVYRFGTILINEIKRLKGPIDLVHEPISPLGARFFKGIGLEHTFSKNKGE
jgi:hypothetical protein